ncbi:uncharacterized protein PV09_09455 [Verruconis gallopava]|uniref:beta-glucosidase n=1 Tax=Verruconis gallopava TaxID=253628 RepID=A0A0D1X9G0_9PEZI|nr:uncharacterized protein PV09_09455 [Verruconis gallopava]KIV98805.1 hypothetical protein PV09_09455 [Verruconis gallopava]
MTVDSLRRALNSSDEDIVKLCGLLTIDEKLSLLAAKNIWETQEISRLGIPSLKVTDGPNGARGGEFWDGTTAACFPACVSIAASFDTELSELIGQALGQEAQTKGAYVLLGPTVCCHRSPLGGRNFEAFSEDPFLSGSLAVAYVKGLQSQRVAATVKHFLGNEQDTRRFVLNEIISQRALREIYLRPFEKVVKESSPWAFMTSYPKINGYHVDATPTFIRDILRGQWHYDGLTMSDWGATSCITSIKNGLDLEMPGPPRIRTPMAIKTALASKSISASDVDSCVMNILKLLKRVGKFSDRKTTQAEVALDRPEHRALIRKAGADGSVLLKNRDGILPLSQSSIKKIALLGPLADYAAAHGGGSASLNCHYKVTPLEAFRKRLGNEVEITHGKGAHIFRVLPDLEEGTTNSNGKPGFCAEFFMTSDLSGSPFRVEEYPRGSFFTLMNTEVKGSQGVRFTSTYQPPISGLHYLSFSGLGPSKIFINNELIHEQLEDTKDSMAFLLGVQDEFNFRYNFDSSREYLIRIETSRQLEDKSELYLLDGQIAVHLGLVTQQERDADLQAEAVKLAREADYAIIFVGNTVQWETEGQDLASMKLPAEGSQDNLIAAVAAVNAKTIVVNTTGVPIETPWIDSIAALIQAWYAGQETGNAILDLLLGDVNPSGKLPVSWPKMYDHCACYGNFGLDAYDSLEVEYVEDIFVGYRHFDRMYGTEKEVRFPFGFGLSYSQFEIIDAACHGSISPDTAVSVSFTVRNISSRAGAETVQVYLAPPKSSTAGRPPKCLVGFKKVYLDPGQSRRAEISFIKDDAAYWNEDVQKWQVESGEHYIIVASSSATKDVKATIPLTVQGFIFDP